MQRKHSMSVFIAVIVMLSGGTMANDIYKWTDAEGNVHYRDRPSGEPSEVRLGIASKPTDKSALAEQQDSFVAAQARRAESKAAAADAAKAAEAEAQAAAEKQKRCDGYRKSLQRYSEARRLYKEGPDGERTYLDEEETLKARQQLEAHIAENCSG